MQAVTFFFAFVAVLALIGVAAWLVRRFASNRLGANPNRGRMPRLAVIDAAAVDGRRRLVLVRRDNIEHLLMIGGPTDIVVESNIVRATPQREQLPLPMPARPGGAEAPPARAVPLPDAASWLEGEGDHHHEPQMPEPPPRPTRPSFADEVRRVPPAAAERRSDPLVGFGVEPLSPRPEPRLEQRLEPRPDPRLETPRLEPRGEPRLEPRPEPRHEARPEPMPPRMPRGEPMMPRSARLAEAAKAPPMRAPERPAAPPPPPPPPPAASADQNLAEMAQRLEAALRRPGGDPAAPPVAPEAPPAPPARAAQRIEPPAPPPPVASPKTTFENLEDEMASLLGRPKSSSSS